MSVEQFKAIFRQADTDNSGSLTLDELTVLMKKYGYNPRNIRDLFISADTSHDNKISEGEFLSVMGVQPPEVHSEAKDRHGMMSVFRSFDKNDDGTIDKTELAAVFAEMGKVMPQAHIDRMMELKDKDGNQTLNYEEFVDAVLRR